MTVRTADATVRPVSKLRRLFGASKDMPRKSHASGYMPVRSYMVAPGQPVWSERQYAPFAAEAYIRNVVAHRAMDMVGHAAASVPFRLMVTPARGARREVKLHPLLSLLAAPHPQMGQGAFLHALYQYRLLSGNVFVQAVGPKGAAPRELHLLRPDRVAVIAGKAGLPAGYRYTGGNRTADYPVDAISGRSCVLHIKTFHPLSDWYGLSPVEAAAYSIDQHNQAGAWNQALLQNGARPSGALVVRADGPGGGALSEDQYFRMRQQVDEQFAGPSNAGRPLLLEGGLEWREMSLSPRDMDFIESKNSAARDIALAFGVPPQLLGIPGDNTYSNLQEARLALWEQTVLPLAKTVATSLSAWLLPMFGLNGELEIDTSGVTPLAARNQIIWERLQNADFLTDNEKRAAVGYGPLDE